MSDRYAERIDIYLLRLLLPREPAWRCYVKIDGVVGWFVGLFDDRMLVIISRLKWVPIPKVNQSDDT